MTQIRIGQDLDHCNCISLQQNSVSNPATPCLKKPVHRAHTKLRDNFMKTDGFPRILAEMIVVHLPTDYGSKVDAGWQPTARFHGNSSTSAGARRLSVHVQQWNPCVGKRLALFHRNYGSLTARVLATSISLQDFRLHAGARVQKASTLPELFS